MITSPKVLNKINKMVLMFGLGNEITNEKIKSLVSKEIKEIINVKCPYSTTPEKLACTLIKIEQRKLANKRGWDI